MARDSGLDYDTWTVNVNVISVTDALCERLR